MREKKILIVTDDAGESFEILYAQQRFREAGYQPVVAATEKKRLNAVIHDFYPGWNTYVEKPGYLIASDITFDAVDVDDYEAVLLMAGAPRVSPAQRQGAQDREDLPPAGEVDLSICHGIQILLAAGIGRGLKLTCYENVRFELESCGGTWVNQECVRDGRSSPARPGTATPISTAKCSSNSEARLSPAPAGTITASTIRDVSPGSKTWSASSSTTSCFGARRAHSVVRVVDRHQGVAGAVHEQPRHGISPAWSMTEPIPRRSSTYACDSTQPGFQHQPGPGVRSPNVRSAKARVCTMAASDTRTRIRGSRLARSTPTAPPMLCPRKRSAGLAGRPAPRPDPRPPSRCSNPRSAPRTLALPENEMRNAAIPASARPSARATRNGAVLVRGHAVADDDDGTVDLGARVIGVVEALAGRGCV